MLYFLHIPKTGGTTIRKALIRSTKVFKMPLHVSTTMDDFKKRLTSLTNEKVVVGHFTYGIHNFVNAPHEYATLLRHPAAFVFSCFDFTKLTVRCGQQHVSAPYVKGTILDYVRNAPQAQNAFARQICGKGILYDGPIVEADYEVALSNLKTFKHVGVTENIGKFWKKLQDDYGFTSSIGHERKAKVYRAEKIKQSDVDEILKYNEWDLKLYEAAKGMI